MKTRAEIEALSKIRAEHAASFSASHQKTYQEGIVQLKELNRQGVTKENLRDLLELSIELNSFPLDMNTKEYAGLVKKILAKAEQTFPEEKVLKTIKSNYEKWNIFGNKSHVLSNLIAKLDELSVEFPYVDEDKIQNQNDAMGFVAGQVREYFHGFIGGANNMIDDYRRCKKDVMYILDNKKVHVTETPLEKVYNALILVIRGFFRLFDCAITCVTRSKQTMANTETPFAKKLVGRAHFVEYTVAARLNGLSSELNAAMKELDNAVASTHKSAPKI